MAIATSTILAATAIAGVGLQTYGQISQSNQQADLMEFNAEVAEAEAKNIEAAKNIELAQIERDKRRERGSIYAQIGQNGISATGSPMAIVLDSATKFEMEKEITRYNASIGVSRAKTSAAMSRAQGYSTKAAATIGATTTALTRGSQIGTRYFGKTTPSTATKETE